jgi:membrane fusion protein (multidrug efflux system)
MAAIGLGLAAGAAWWLQRPAQTTAAATAAPAAGRQSGGPPAVEVVRVATARIQDDAQAVGSLRSRQSVTLRPEVAGRVAQIGFEDGARVRRGQMMVQLDDVLQRAELSQAQAQLSIASANLQRNQDLVEQNFVARRVLDESKANLQVAQAQVALAQARLQRMRITAPFDGTVGLRRINLGEYVKDGADLVNLEDTSALVVDFRLPERYQSRIAVGQTVQVLLDALPNQKFTARVQALDPLLDADGRSLAVRASLPATRASELRPGMFARVLTVFAVDDAALVVPEEAIVPQGGKQFVILIETEGEGDAMKRLSRRTEVQLGLRRGAQVQITSGLAAGDTVVVAGQQRLQKDGTAVRVVEAGGGAAAANPKPAAKAPATSPTAAATPR